MSIVARVRCPTYTDVRAALERALALLPGDAPLAGLDRHPLMICQMHRAYREDVTGSRATP